MSQQPTGAFIAASWIALGIGALGYIASLWTIQLPFTAKLSYFTCLMFGLFSAVSLQKSVRDRADNIPVTNIYFGICWASIFIAIGVLVIQLWNTPLINSEKGFIFIAYLMSLYGSITVQKNIRDLADGEDKNAHSIPTISFTKNETSHTDTTDTES